MKWHKILLPILLCTFTCSISPLFAQNNGAPGTWSPNNVEPLNGNGSLGNTYNVTKCGLNFTQASIKVTTRSPLGGLGSGLPATLNISGIPSSCVTIEQAYLYYVVSNFPGSPASPTVNVTNPAMNNFSYTASNIGTDGEKCWGETDTKTFRVDVTNAISGNGNYVINSTTPVYDLDGMTLMIIYRDNLATYQGTMVLADGLISANSAVQFMSASLGGFNACANSTSGTAFIVTSDYQLGGHSSTLNGVTLAFPDLFYNYDSAPTIVLAGQASAAFETFPTSGVDCYSWSVMGLYYQTTTCATCPTPFTLNVVGTNGCPPCNGSATVTPSGPGGPYTYAWAPSGGNAATANNLCAGIYTVTVTAAGGCITTTSTVTISDNPAPTPAATNTGPYCAGETIQLNSPGGFATDDWSGPGGYTSTNTQNPVIINSTPAMSGTYTVTVTNALGCTGTATTTVTVNSLPTPTATNTGPYCVGQNIQLNSPSGSATDDWAGPGGYTSTNTQNPVIVNSTPAMSGIYTVTVTNAFGCSATATTTVTVNSVPTATATNTGPYCAGQTIQLNSVGGSPTDDWSGPGGYTSTNTQNPTISNATTAMNGTYTVTVTNGFGCSATATTNVTVNPLPTANATNTGPYCPGQTIQLNSVGGSATDDWAGPGGYTAMNTQNPTIINATLAMSGVYTVTVTNGFGCSITANTTVTVNPAPVANATNTGPYCDGQTIQLNSVGGSATDDWSGPGGYTSTNTQNPIILNATVAMSGTYTVIATNGFGCTSTSTTTVTVNTIPSATATNTGPYCEGQTIQLNSVGGSPTDDWSGPGGYTSTNTQNPTIINSTVAMSGVYTVTVSNVAGCSATATTSVTVNPSPSANATNTGPYCEGQTIQLNSVGGSGTDDWSGPGGYTSTNTQNPVILNSTSSMSGLYTVTVTNGFGCTSTSAISVTVNAVPTATAGNTGPYCSGATIVLNASGGSGYSWTGPLGFSDGTQNPNIASATPGMSGVYTVIVTNAGGCTSSATTTVTVNSAASASASNTGPYCEGSTINLNSPAGGINYDWVGPAGYAITNTQNPNIANATVSMSGVYTVTVTTAGGCTGTATTTVSINALPVAMASNTGPYCTGETILLNSSGGTGYNWSGPLGYSDGTQNPSIPSSTSGMSGIYTVTVTDVSGCSATATTTVNVAGGLIVSAGSNSPVCEGQALNLNSTLIAGGVYSWSGPGGFSSAMQNPSISPANLTNTGTYTVTITNPSGCSGTATVSASINTLPSPISSNGGPYCAGTTIQLNSNGGVGYAWSGPNGYSDGTQNPSIPLCTTAMSGDYTVTVTNAAGCTSTSTTTVTVNALPNSIATNTGPYCIGSTIQLNSPSGFSTDDWAGPGGYSSTDVQNPTILNATVAMSGTYTVTITNAASCSVTATTNVVVNSTAPATANNTGPYCEGATINLSSANGAINYDWTGPGGYTITNTQNPTINGATVAMSGVYTVTVTIAGGCTGTATTSLVVNALPTPTANNTGPYCAGTTIQLNSPTGNPLDDWSGPGGYTISNTQNPQILNATVSMNGTYTVIVTDANGCSATATTNVLINSSPLATASNNTPICETEAINFNANGGINYDWVGPNGFIANGNQNPTITNSNILDGGVYTVTVTDVNGCSATATTTVVVNSSLLFTASSNSPICAGDQLNLSAQNIAGAIYDWSGPNGYIANNQQNPIIASAGTAAAGTYTVSATSSVGCSGTATVNVVVNGLPNPSFTADVLIGCAPLCVNFTDMSSSVGSSIVAWNWNIESQISSSAQNVNECFNSAGFYDASLTVTDANGCVANISLNDYINVYSDPVASFSFTPNQILPDNPSISFTNTSQGAVNFFWDFGDGSTSTDVNPTHTYATTDTFCILLTITNSGGCMDTSFACIDYVPDFSLFIPNSFTPNQDESNNVFTVYGLGIRSLMARIFDRWGREIYNFDNVNNGWAGTTDDGLPCQVGVYVYRVEVTDVNGHWHEYIGQVNLIR